MKAEWVSAIGAILACLVALLGVFVAWAQLSGLRETLKTNTLMAVLAIESELGERKGKCDEVAMKIKQLELTAGNPAAHQKELELFRQALDLATENWLNALERLCFCINKSYVPEKDWKSEYYEYVADVVDTQCHFFEHGSTYTNISALHAKWSERK